MKFLIPDYVKFALNTLHNAGFDAWIVGGSVRDSIMNNAPKDYDIASSAKPTQVVRLFEKTIPTGIKHGTVTVLIEKQSIEITTYRTDGCYNDSRHPDKVCFVSDITEDLSRRDFTVNAMAYNEEKGIFDPFGGMEDINNKTLKSVGDAKKRFGEDALRILRLFRFSSQLGFEIEPRTFSAAVECAPSLIKVSGERIREELLKALCGLMPDKLNSLLKTNALCPLGLSSKTAVDDKLCLIPENPCLRFSYFCFYNSISPEEICKTLKASNAFLKECETVCRLLKDNPPKTKTEIKKILSKTDINHFTSYIKIYEALNNTSYLSDDFKEITENNEPFRIDMLKVSGKDLISLGYSGKSIGKTLEYLLEKVIEDPEMNTADSLKALM